MFVDLKNYVCVCVRDDDNKIINIDKHIVMTNNNYFSLQVISDSNTVTCNIL